MIFDSFEFAYFIAIVLPLYFLLPLRGQNGMLLVASYFFYGYWDWRFLSLLLISTIIDYSAGFGIARSPEQRIRKSWLVLSIVGNLGILGFFKYCGFFVDSFQDLLEAFGIGFNRVVLDFVLPVGISFYTFQTMSYTIDVYRGDLPAERNLLNFALYVSFFPQLVAGPIERATNLIPQIANPRRHCLENFKTGGWLIFWGLYKKVFVADNLSKIVDPVYTDLGGATGFAILVATYAFAFQIYADFSAYTDIARGTARIMGFELMLNFRLPYFAENPSDFWKRWHISLSQWLRDYLYIPLGGGRGTAAMVQRNLMITMLLGGLWHGARWNFVAWGFYHGLLLILHRRFARGNDSQPAGEDPLHRRILRILLMFHLTCLGWVLFRIERLADLGPIATGMVHRLLPAEADWTSARLLIGHTALLLLVQLLQYRRDNLLAVLSLPTPVRVLLYLLLYFSLTLGGAFDGRAFIYFQF